MFVVVDLNDSFILSLQPNEAIKLLFSFYFLFFLSFYFLYNINRRNSFYFIGIVREIEKINL